MNAAPQSRQLAFLKFDSDLLFRAAYDAQFKHFMGVFYFWITVMTFPGSAGLIAGDHIRPHSLGLLLISLAVLGLFISLKMFDIRCSQLTYVHHLNNERSEMVRLLGGPTAFQIPIPYVPPPNLRNAALTDFGFWMALIMSSIEGIYMGYGLYRYEPMSCYWCGGCILFLVGTGAYLFFILAKVPAR